MDYEQRIKALRYCISGPNGVINCKGCPYFGSGIDCQNELHKDAADAIEELQAEADRANKSADAYRAMYFAKRGDITIEKVKELDEIDCHFHSALIRLMYKRIEEFESEKKTQLPKRGEWVWDDKRCIYVCSVCGSPKVRENMDRQIIKEQAYCYSCGAKMEVQE